MRLGLPVSEGSERTSGDTFGRLAPESGRRLDRLCDRRRRGFFGLGETVARMGRAKDRPAVRCRNQLEYAGNACASPGSEVRLRGAPEATWPHRWADGEWECREVNGRASVPGGQRKGWTVQCAGRAVLTAIGDGGRQRSYLSSISFRGIDDLILSGQQVHLERPNRWKLDSAGFQAGAVSTCCVFVYRDCKTAKTKEGRPEG